MLLSDILKHKVEIKSIVSANKGLDIKLFGSTAAGDANNNSDVDFLVSFRNDASLFDLVEMKIELEELLGSDVDIISTGGLKDNEIGKNIRRSSVSI